MDNPWRDYKTNPPPNEKATLLVWLEKSLHNSRLQVAYWNVNIQVIGGSFIFDAPKILKWKYANEFFYEEE